MNRLEDFIINDQMPDIAYRTNQPEEVVHPRVNWRDGVPMIYQHNLRFESHKGHVPVVEFLEKLAQREPGLAATGYRANGKQTTISFNKSDRVTLSPRMQAYLSNHVMPPRFDADAKLFLACFLDSSNPQLRHWLPGYVDTLAIVRDAVTRQAYADAFELIWKTPNNMISNAGQGFMGGDNADKQRDRLIEVTRDIAQDGSPACYDAMVQRFQQWWTQGDLHNTPRLMVARAFAALHPDRYHTTVDAAKQDRLIGWFASHTGFVDPGGNWASRASALATHLDRCGVFADRELRNMFPWFVHEQMGDETGRAPFRPGHTSRAPTGQAQSVGQIREINYRQNLIQDRLFEMLCQQHGKSCVGTECATGTGGFADALVKLPNGRYALYEIKPAPTAMSAVRQAMGQLLEYAYRKGGLEPASLHVVSDAALDDTTSAFLMRLKSEFGLPVEYLQVSVAS